MSSRLKLDRWTLSAVVICGLFLMFTSVASTDLPVADTGLSWIVVFMMPAVAALASATAMKLHADPSAPRPSRALVVAASAFGLMLLWAAASLPLVRHWASVEVGDPTTVVPVPLPYLVTPLIASGLTCLLAILAVNLAPPAQLFRLLWLFAVAGAIGTPIATWWNAMGGDLYGRLATKLGGAAVLHTALLLGMAICIAAALQGHRRMISVLAAVAYLGYFIATGARAGIISLAVFLALMTLPPIIKAARERPSRLPLLVTGALAAAITFVLAARWVLLTRGIDGSGSGRVDTWSYGLDQAVASLSNLVFGVGYGVLWPWYAFEAYALPQPGAHGQKQMPEGVTLSHAHNLYVAVLSEQGLVGTALLLVVLAVVVWAWWRARGVVERTLASALAATLVGFAFDTYLTKNFPVSFVWWVTLAALLTMMSHRRRAEERDETIPGFSISPLRLGNR